MKLIDLNFIPTRIKQRILNAYNTYEIQPLDGKKVVKSLFKQKLHGVRSQWTTVSKHLRDLE